MVSLEVKEEAVPETWGAKNPGRCSLPREAAATTKILDVTNI